MGNRNYSNPPKYTASPNNLLLLIMIIILGIVLVIVNYSGNNILFWILLFGGLVFIIMITPIIVKHNVAMRMAEPLGNQSMEVERGRSNLCNAWLTISGGFSLMAYLIGFITGKYNPSLWMCIVAIIMFFIYFKIIKKKYP